MSDDFKSKKQPTGDYDVGYGKTPKHTRWKPGQSGNRRGRPKRKFTTDLGEAGEEALAQRVTVPFNGKLKPMTLAQHTMHKAAVASASGDDSARRFMHRVQQQHRQDQKERSGDVEPNFEVTLVFPEEENHLMKLAEENRQLIKRIQYLEVQQLKSSEGSANPEQGQA